MLRTKCWKAGSRLCHPDTSPVVRLSPSDDLVAFCNAAIDLCHGVNHRHRLPARDASNQSAYCTWNALPTCAILRKGGKAVSTYGDIASIEMAASAVLAEAIRFLAA